MNSSHEVRFKQFSINKYYILLFLSFVIVGGFRFMVGSDYIAYARGFHIEFSSIIRRFLTFDEPIIYLITSISREIWNRGEFVIFVENLITVYFVFKGLRKHEHESLVMPLLLYILYCGWTSSFGAIRQCLAASVIFAYADTSGEDRKLLRSTLLCFVAFLIHRSALLMLPVVILANRRFGKEQVVLLLLASFVVPFVGSKSLAFMDVSMNDEYAMHSVNIMRVIVSMIPPLLLLFSTRDFIEENSFVINMSIVNAIITFSTRNSALMYRFSDYTCMYLMLYIPKCEELFPRNSRRLYRVITILLFLAYFYVEINTGNSGLRQFNWVFGNPGVY